MLKVAFHTLGCKVNQYETESMIGQFSRRNYTIVDFHDKADIYIINTCTVTHLSDRKSRQMLRKAKRTNPDALVAAVGCYAQISPEVIAEIKKVDLILGNIDKNKIVDIIEDQEQIKSRLHVYDIYELKEYEEMKIFEVHDKTRAFIKIQDGCNQYCSYCIIPYARGTVRSRDKDSIYEEVQGLATNGYKEIVLTGIHIASYGLDLNDLSLFELIEYIHDIKGIERIRLGSLEQHIIDESFMKLAPSLKKLCPHFHLSLQSGSDSVLKRMNRKYSTQEYYEKVEMIRLIFPKASITTDIIVGFPGETEEEFAQTVEFVNKVAFSDVHVFKFSIRKGTKAAVMENQIDEKIKHQRSEKLIELVHGLKNDYYEQFIGTYDEVLFETKHDSVWIGHNSHYLKVELKSDQNFMNQIVKVRLTKLSNDLMSAIIE